MARHDNYIQTLAEYQANIKKDLMAMRKCRDEIMKVKEEFLDRFGQGQYIRDDKRIVISAPEIIIGNVFRDGSMINEGTSKITIRGNQIRQEATADNYGNSSITNMASEIKNICADPGPDGKEAFVNANSRFTVLAEGIALQSENTMGTFVETPTANDGEIKIAADKHITLAAQAPLTRRKKQIEKLLAEKKQEKEKLKKDSFPTVASFKSKFQTYDQLVEEASKDEQLANAPGFQDMCKKKREIISKDLDKYQATVSRFATIEYEKESLECIKSMIDASIKRGYTPATIDIMAEKTNINSMNADMKVCKHKGAGLGIVAKKVNINSFDDKDGLLVGSEFAVNTQNITLSTANKINAGNDGSVDMDAKGTVTITSRDIVLESVNKEIKSANDDPTEKALTQGGNIHLRAETVNVSTNDSEGNAFGRTCINSKHIALTTSNVDPDNGRLKVAEDGHITLWAHKIHGGYIGDAQRDTSNIILSSGNASFRGTLRAEITQDHGKALLQMEEGNTYIKGSQNEISGSLDVFGKSAFKSAVSFTTATAKALEVESYLKTPNTTEGNNVGGADASAPDRKEFLEFEKEYNEAAEKEEKERQEKKEEEKKKKEEEKKQEQQKKKEEEQKRQEWEKKQEEERNKAKSGMEDMPPFFKDLK